MIYTVRQCLIHTRNAVPMPCPCRAPTMPLGKRLLGATAQHKSGTEMHVLINIYSLLAAFGRPAQIRLLPAITRIFTKVFNQNATAFLDVLTCSDNDDDDDDEDSRSYRIMLFLWTNLKVTGTDSLSSVVLIRLQRVFFFWLSVGNNYFKISKFEVIILICLTNYSSFLSDVQTECQILVPFLLL